MKKALLFLALFLIIIAAAQGFIVKIEPEQLSVKEESTAELDLSISHSKDMTKTFEIYSPNVIWDIMTAKPLRVEPKQLFETTLYIKPLNVNPGIYRVPLHVRMAGTSDVEEKHLQVEVLSLYPPALEYLPAIRGDARIQRDVDPRKEITVRINLENRNRRELKQVNIKLRSNTINQDYTTELSPLEKKELKFKVNIDDLTPPQEDVLMVSVVVPEKDQAYQFDLEPARFEIESFSKLDENIDEEKSFLKTTYYITLANTGNTLITEEYKRPTNWFKNIFATTTPKAEKTKGELVWKVELERGETEEIVYTFNFIPLFIMIIIVIVLITSYYVFRSPIVLRKTATIVRTSEGGISELKIILEALNRSKRPVKKIRIIDTVPSLADVTKEHDSGTLKPDNVIKHEKRGTILKWTIDRIEPGEERVLTYKIKSKLSILGGVTLPPTVAKFSKITGRERTANSNSPTIGFIG